MDRGGLSKRLARLEEQAREDLARWDGERWPVAEQLAAVADELDFHATFGTVAICTDREINLLAALAADGGLDGPVLSLNASPEDLPAGLREHVQRMDPRSQERRDRWLFENRHSFEPWREKVRRVQEEQRAYVAEAKQRDRELLERNRASVGLPALTPGQIAQWGLKGTKWEGHDA